MGMAETTKTSFDYESNSDTVTLVSCSAQLDQHENEASIGFCKLKNEIRGVIGTIGT